MNEIIKMSFEAHLLNWYLSQKKTVSILDVTKRILKHGLTIMWKLKVNRSLESQEKKRKTLSLDLQDQTKRGKR